MHLVGDGTRREIMHGVAKVGGGRSREVGGGSGALAASVVPYLIPNEYLKTMAALALAARERSSRVGGATVGDHELRCLFLGLGAGTLPRFCAHCLPGAALVAIECDHTVCDAAVRHLGVEEGRIHVVRADARQWVEEAAAAGGAESERFDLCFTDVFDEHNACPPAFWSDSFLASLSRIMSDSGVVVHNFHAGSKALDADVAAAEAAYARVFGTTRCCRAAALDSKPWAGNAILAATKDRSSHRMFSRAELVEAARHARTRWGVGFDLAARCSLVDRGEGGAGPGE